MGVYRYSEWDGSQGLFDLDADELMDQVGHNLFSGRDLSDILQMMQFRGIRNSQGTRLPSIQELLQQLRQKRQSQLQKYKLGSVMDDIRRKIDNILKMERQGIQRKLNESRQKAGKGSGELNPEEMQRLLNALDEKATQNLKKLDALPPDIGGKIKTLAQYDFMDEEAKRQFQELMDMLKKNAMESYGRDLIQQIKNLDASALASIRHMVEAINHMLEQRMKGEEPDFKKFMEQFGNYFGPQPPQNLDELIERLQSQIAQAQSLLGSLSPEDREELIGALNSVIDAGTEYELAKLATNLETLYPSDKLRKEYLFSGEESISYSEAIRLMETLQKMDKLEAQFMDSQFDRSIDAVDEQLVKELIGNQAAEELEKLRNITRILEEAGYIHWKDNKYQLTPRGMRKIGQKALQDIYAQLKKDRLGGHNIKVRGAGGERLEETKKYEFGDDFNIHIQKTIMNSLYRDIETRPIRLNVEDFEVFKTEGLTQSATVLMLDLSLSMPMRGNFEAAKRVAIALDGLIRTQYPKDSLYIVGFSSYARQVKKEDLCYMVWDEFDPYTNIQHGLCLARKLLTKERCTNKNIILVSDGEPTAHIEDGNIFSQYPPSLRTLQLTLREVRNCTKRGIVINTFMLERGAFLSAFVTQMARTNKGRVFFTSADGLGQYLLVDYISKKKRAI
jgi:uncharacterized protein with von Willebrand factor type A (vWA) domain